MNTKSYIISRVRQVLYLLGFKGAFQGRQRLNIRLAVRPQLQSAYFWNCGDHSKGYRVNTKPRALTHGPRQLRLGNRGFIVLENRPFVEFLGHLQGRRSFKDKPHPFSSYSR